MERSNPFAVYSNMMRIAAVLVSAMMLAGRGSSIGTDSGTNGDNSMGSSPAPPVSTQPPWETSTHPPPAFLGSASGRTALTIGSYCWSVISEAGGVGGCGDSPPFDLINDLATVQVAEGETVMLVLALTPSKPIEVSLGGHGMKLPAATRSEWDACRPRHPRGVRDVPAGRRQLWHSHRAAGRVRLRPTPPVRGRSGARGRDAGVRRRRRAFARRSGSLHPLQRA